MALPSVGPRHDIVPLTVDLVPPYLERYGYLAADAAAWRNPPPQPPPDADAGAAAAVAEHWPHLELHVTGHREEVGHTWYTIECSLVAPGSRRLHWEVTRRLEHLREALHDCVKAELECRARSPAHDGYGRHFAGAPFARKGGLPGTTTRLRGWCAALAMCINSGTCTPSIVGLTLNFLEAPEPCTMADAARGAAASAAGRVRGAIGSAKTQLGQKVERAHEQAKQAAANAAVGCAKSNPKTANAASAAAFSFAKQNPKAAQAVSGSALSFMMKNPQVVTKSGGAALSVAKLVAKAKT